MWKTLVYNNEKLDAFQINIDGIIKSVKTGKEYTNYVGKTGYVLCSLPLGRRGRCKNIRIHKALAEAYLDNVNNLPVVHHKDENKTNNKLDNLEWVTHKTNTHEHLKKELSKNRFANNRKLTQSQVIDIKTNKSHLPCTTLAKQYSVSRTTIYNVLKNVYYNGV